MSNKLVFLSVSEGRSSLQVRGTEGTPGSSHVGTGRSSLSMSVYITVVSLL